MRRPNRLWGAAVLAGAATVATLGTSPAQSAPPADNECPPAAETVTAGQRVTGKTVSQGVTPETFQGEVIGVLDDAIAPEIDMIMVRLSSEAIDAAGGIWHGMSGSPVYTTDGDLIGAVAYGLGTGPSPVTGVTPAAAMQELLTAAPADPAAAASLRIAAERDEVALPSNLQRKVVAAGAATTLQAQSGLSRLPLPLAVSGVRGADRLNALVRRLGLDNARPYQSGAVGASSATYPIVSGSNVVASMSSGDLSIGWVGTATAVCGDEVLAFGHTAAEFGATTMALHGATAVYVQEDPTLAPAKFVNVGAASGIVTEDRTPGLLGTFGSLPTATDITSTVTVGAKSRTGSSLLNVQEYVPDLAAIHLQVDQFRVFDAWAKGSAVSTWTVKGIRADGTPFSFTRGDRFASTWDIVADSAWPLSGQLYRLQNNDTEEVTFTEIDTTSRITPAFQKYAIKNVQIRAGGRWRPVPEAIAVRPGTVKRFLVTLSSRQMGMRLARLRLEVPRWARGKYGELQIMGGNSYYSGEEEFFDESGMSEGMSFDEALAAIKAEPRNDEVLASLTMYRRGGAVLQKVARTRVGAVVNGGRWLEVYGR